jgi:hypothetical protein
MPPSSEALASAIMRLPSVFGYQLHFFSKGTTWVYSPIINTSPFASPHPVSRRLRVDDALCKLAVGVFGLLAFTLLDRNYARPLTGRHMNQTHSPPLFSLSSFQRAPWELVEPPSSPWPTSRKRPLHAPSFTPSADPDPQPRRRLWCDCQNPPCSPFE